MPLQSLNGDDPGDLPPLPFSETLWDRIAAKLRFSPQQKRIVELILRKQQDKEIAELIDLQVPTVRTYMRRVFQSTQTANRVELLILIMETGFGDLTPAE